MAENQLDDTQKQLDAEAIRQLQLLRKLEMLEEFRAWRDAICRVGLEQLKANLAATGDTMPEVVLRANLKTIQSLDYYFYKVFDVARLELEVNKPEVSS